MVIVMTLLWTTWLITNMMPWRAWSWSWSRWSPALQHDADVPDHDDVVMAIMPWLSQALSQPWSQCGHHDDVVGDNSATTSMVTW
jgi:hypothetical protein